MKSLIGRRLEMAARVREFSRAHVGTEPGYGPALARLEERLTRAQTMDARFHEGLNVVRQARSRRVELRRVIHIQVVSYLVALDELAASLPNTAFITRVKGLIGDAGQHKAKLLELGVPATLLDDLSRMVAEFETASEAIRTAQRDHIGAKEDLEAICIDLMELVKLIGGITGYRFGNDRDVMAEWRAARQIPRQPRAMDSGTLDPSSDVRPAA